MNENSFKAMIRAALLVTAAFLFAARRWPWKMTIPITCRDRWNPAPMSPSNA